MVILGGVGDNFGAGMTGGMAFVYDTQDIFEKSVNPETVIWQRVETNYWKEFLKNLILEHVNETNSKTSNIILDNFNSEINNFYQICPKEMIDKLKNPITEKGIKDLAV